MRGFLALFFVLIGIQDHSRPYSEQFLVKMASYRACPREFPKERDFFLESVQQYLLNGSVLKVNLCCVDIVSKQWYCE